MSKTKEKVTLEIDGIAKKSEKEEGVLEVSGEVLNTEEFKAEIVQEVKQLLLDLNVPSELLQELMENGADKHVGLYQKIDNLNFRMSRIEQDMRTEYLASGTPKSRETGRQEGIILCPDAGIKPQKFPKIDVKNLHLKTFIRKNRSETEDVQ